MIATYPGFTAAIPADAKARIWFRVTVPIKPELAARGSQAAEKHQNAGQAMMLEEAISYALDEV